MTNNTLAIQAFIQEHSDWEKLLSEKPYCLQISREVWNSKHLLLLKYNQIESDFHEPIVRQCRGLILDEDTLEVISHPFDKFGNVNEGSWVEPISWAQHPYVLEKIDGSLIKIVKLGNDLLISTNGTILADKAPIAEQLGCKAKTFGDLVDEGLAYYGLNRDFLNVILDDGFTYMFELTSPWNRVVVDHHETKLWFIGCRNNKTSQEVFIMDHPLADVFDTPKLYEFDSFERCIETAKALPWNQEGYVVTSKDFKRNKVKSLAYLSCHHLRNNGVMSYARALTLVQLNEVNEVLAYFPEFKDALLEVQDRYRAFEARLAEDKKKLETWLQETGFAREPWLVESGGAKRKDAAVFIMKEFKTPAFGFALLDKKAESAEAFIAEADTKFLLKALGYKES